MGYSSMQAWEWQGGYLFHFPIEAHVALVRILEWIGVEGPYAQSVGLRWMYGILSLLPVLAAARLVRWATPSDRRGERLGLPELAALIIAVWPEQIFRSIRLMDYSLEMSGVGAAILLALPLSARSSRIPWRHLAAGIVLGALFFVRPQSGLHLISLCLLIASAWRDIRSADFKPVLGMCTGYGAIVLLINATEPAGGFLTSFFKYYQWNLDHASEVYGADPWHRYITDGAKAYGIVGAAVILWFSARLLMQRRVQGKMLLVLPFLPLAVHSMIEHKEARYIVGFLWLLVPVACAGMQGWRPSTMTRRAVIALIAISGIISAYRVFDRFNERALDLKAWDRMSRILESPALSSLPIWIQGDPDFLPGGFFLRSHGPLCYQKGDQRIGDCAWVKNRMSLDHLMLRDFDEPMPPHTTPLGDSGRFRMLRRMAPDRAVVPAPTET